MSLQDMISRLSSNTANDDETGRRGPDTVSQADIVDWLVLQLADQVGLDPSEIDSEKPCAEYGLDSIAGVSIAGDLEVWLDLPLSPTLLWDYPSIDRVSQYLMTALEDEEVALRRAPISTSMAGVGNVFDPAVAEQLLAQLDTWSEAEVDTLLNDLLAA
jgi:acyl carrier protein